MDHASSQQIARVHSTSHTQPQHRQQQQQAASRDKRSRLLLSSSLSRLPLSASSAFSTPVYSQSSSHRLRHSTDIKSIDNQPPSPVPSRSTKHRLLQHRIRRHQQYQHIVQRSSVSIVQSFAPIRRRQHRRTARAISDMDTLGSLAYEMDKADERMNRAGGGKGATTDGMQAIDISDDSDSEYSVAEVGQTSDEDEPMMQAAASVSLSPDNPFLLICNSLCSSASSASSIHVTPPPASSIPPHSRIALSSLPADLRSFIVSQQYPTVEGGLLPPWVGNEHVHLLSQLWDKHVACERASKAEWKNGGGKRDDSGRVIAGKDKELRVDKKVAAVGSLSTSQASSISSSSSFSHSSTSQQPTPVYSIITTSDSPNPPPSSPHTHTTSYTSYTPQRQLPSTPVPPPLLSPSLSKQTARIAETIRRLYGLSSEEKGHKLIGHTILTPDDQSLAAEHKCDLLYGEVLPEGVSRMFDTEHLDLNSARTVYDLGSGLGKLAMQAYLQYGHLDWVCGVELARSRSSKGFEALRKLSKLRLAAGGTAAGLEATVTSGIVEEGKDGMSVKLTETIQSNVSSYSKCLGRTKKNKRHRYFELRCADLFTVTDAWQADVVICETKFPEEKYRDLAIYMSQMKPSVRVLTYEDLDVVYAYCHLPNPYVRFDNNHSNDRFYTTWAPNYGYRFHLWRKREGLSGKAIEEEKREEKSYKQE